MNYAHLLNAERTLTARANDLYKEIKGLQDTASGKGPTKEAAYAKEKQDERLQNKLLGKETEVQNPFSGVGTNGFVSSIFEKNNDKIKELEADKKETDEELKKTQEQIKEIKAQEAQDAQAAEIKFA